MTKMCSAKWCSFCLGLNVLNVLNKRLPCSMARYGNVPETLVPIICFALMSLLHLCLYSHSFAIVRLFVVKLAGEISQCVLTILSPAFPTCHFSTTSDPFYQRCLTVTAWISRHMPSKVCNEITYPPPKFKGCIVELWEWISYSTPHTIVDAITYSCGDWG